MSEPNHSSPSRFPVWVDSELIQQAGDPPPVPAHVQDKWAHILQADVKAFDRKWHTKRIPEVTVTHTVKIFIASKLLRVARLGVPESMRGRVWLRLSGGEALMAAEPYLMHTVYMDTLHLAPNAPLEEKAAAVSAVSSRTLPAHCLTREHGEVLLQCLLIAVPTQRHDINYEPWLPMLAASFLHYMDEKETFYSLVALLRTPSLVVDTRLASWLFVGAADALARHMMEGEMKYACRRAKTKYPPSLSETHPLLGFFTQWPSSLPLWTLHRLIDVFLAEGQKVFFRFVLAILGRLGCGEPMIPRRESTGSIVQPEEIEERMGLVELCMHASDTQALLDEMFALNFSRNDIVSSMKKCMPAAISIAAECNTGVNEHGSVGVVLPRELRTRGVSMLSQGEWRELWRDLPSRLHGREIARCFNASDHGYNLGTMYTRLGCHFPSILIIMTKEGHKFGVFSATAWVVQEHARAGGFFGNGHCFVFTFQPHYTSYKWAPSRDGVEQSGQCMVADKQHFAVGRGGSGPAIGLDRELNHGCSYATPTFGNPSFVESHDALFSCIALEVWSLVPARA